MSTRNSPTRWCSEAYLVYDSAEYNVDDSDIYYRNIVTAEATNISESVITQSALDTFQRDGYLFVRGLFSDKQMRDISRWTDEVTAFPEVPGRHMVYYEPNLTSPKERVLSRIENFCPYHDGFNALLNSGLVMGCIDRLFDAPAILFKDKINYKLPGGDGFKAHQDVQAGWDRYAPIHLTMLVSIDDATLENGCLELAPGRHREGLLGSHWEPLDENAAMRYVSCPTHSGDVVFFDSFVPHRSRCNLTDRSRRVLYVTYNRLMDGDHRKRYYTDKRASYPPDVERDPQKTYVFRV